MKNERSRTSGDGKVFIVQSFTGIHESVMMIHPLQTVQQLAPYEVKQLLVQVLQDDDTRYFIHCMLTSFYRPDIQCNNGPSEEQPTSI